MLGYVGYTVYTCIYMYIHGFTAIDWNTKESSICHSHSWGFPWNIFQKSCAESESIWTYARTSPKKTELYTLEMPRTLWQFKIAIMLSKMAHDLRKMVIFRGYIKLPEGSRRYIKTLPIALIILICIWSSVGLLIWLFRRFLLLAMGMRDLLNAMLESNILNEAIKDLPRDEKVVSDYIWQLTIQESDEWPQNQNPCPQWTQCSQRILARRGIDSHLFPTHINLQLLSMRCLNWNPKSHGLSFLITDQILTIKLARIILMLI